MDISDIIYWNDCTPEGKCMDRRIKELYSKDILRTATIRFGIDEPMIKELGGFESFIYEYGSSSDRKILRITHSFHRTVDDINAEMEWVDYLHKNGGDVVGAVTSSNGLFAEKIDIGESYFIASSVLKAPGKGPEARSRGDDATAALPCNGRRARPRRRTPRA